MLTKPFTFILPTELSAKEPPERRGIARDLVRLMVINRASYQVEHTCFNRISEFLRPGDLLVFNTSRTLPGSLEGCEIPIGQCVEIRLAQHLPDDSWLALLLCQQGHPFACGLQAGMQIDFGQGLTAIVESRDSHISRLWKIRFSKSGTQLMDTVYRLGRPIRYDYVSEPWDVQHPASKEEYCISATAAHKINRTHQEGGRVIAVGTTVVRALESVADVAGKVQSQHGYTRLHITASHQLKTVDGLLTGFHEPEASHLDLLTAFLPIQKIEKAYEEAVQQGYLWHEFGDLNLIV
jgi:S-adenosylmethionine:tRNA ribosyltransferase-isomerase